MDNQENKTDHEHEFDGKQDRNFYQKPFDEVTDPLPQIDEESASLAEKEHGKTPDRETTQQQTQPTQQETAPGTAAEINEQDVRDQGDSTRDWDAEHNRSSRQR